jgi:MSHA biogenesis protein MshJ
MIMKERLKALAAKIDALKFNERALLLAAAMVVSVGVWDGALMGPVERDKAGLQNRIAQNETRLSQLEAEAVQIVEIAKRDPNEPLLRQIATAEQQIKEFEAEIKERAGQLIEPREMAQVLQRVLEKTAGLDFVSLEGLGAQPLLKPTKKGGAIAENGARNAYRHGFRIRFSGSYLDTIDYLHALEALPWRFFWEAVELDVKNHPNADGSVVVYTLSLDRSWIGV